MYFHVYSWQVLCMVLYMSFDKFLLAVESCDLSQADKSIIRVSSFSILQNFNFWMIKFTVIPKKTIWHLAIWQNWCFGLFYHSKICHIEKFKFFSVFLVRSKSEKIESIHFAENSGLSCWETEKEVLLPINQLLLRRHSYDTFDSLILFNR